MNATCNWCNSIVEAPDNYDNRIHRCYCGKDCLEKDWLFSRWQSDKRLSELAERTRDENRNKNKDQ